MVIAYSCTSIIYLFCIDFDTLKRCYVYLLYIDICTLPFFIIYPLPVVLNVLADESYIEIGDLLNQYFSIPCKPPWVLTHF